MAPLLENPIGHLATLPVQPSPEFESYRRLELPTVLASCNAIIHGRQSPATLVLSPSAGKIVRIYRRVVPESEFPPGTTYKDYSPKFLLPGLVDAHVHLNEPGWRTEWEGFETGTRAAAFGGVTTLIDMPLNAIPPTTTVENFNTKIKAAKGQCWVDVGFYGGVIPGNQDELVPLVKAGVKGFKCFLINSGVDEFPSVTPHDVTLAMEKLKDTETVLMFHAEMVPPITKSVGDYVTSGEPPLVPTGPLDEYKTFLESRPSEFETYAIDAILSCAPTAPDLRLHIVHLSAAEGVPLVKDAREKGIKLTAETCFHYLTLSAENIDNGDTRHKCCPPIREAANQDILWDALKDGIVTTVVSDHSPCTPDLKLLPSQGGKGDFF
ncbi:Metallo-dependent hydrolase, partial [Ascodesmis nigricans]